MSVSFREQRAHSERVEALCDACNGTGFPPVKQPKEPGKRLYPAPCAKCGGKGRLEVK